MRLYSNILNIKIDFFTVKDDMFALVSNKRGEAIETQIQLKSQRICFCMSTNLA